jgi:hypothetical protein
MTTNSMPEKRLTAATLLRYFVAALAGAVIGQFAARQIIERFEGAPFWVVPAVTIGTVALCIVLVMFVPLYLRRKKQ